MNKIKALVIIGTRPEAIKMAPIIKELQSRSAEFVVRLCVTGQHREMLYQVMEQFELQPDDDLAVMTPNQGLSELTAKILAGIQAELDRDRPDVVLVHGDTTTAMAAGMASFYSGIPVAHVEAGLRTHDLHAPFPEEFNRRVVALSSALHFSPTERAKNNLLAEGVDPKRIFVTGNSVIDALFWTINHIEKTPSRLDSIMSELGALLSFDWKNTPYILITGHRRENYGQGFSDICDALTELAISHPEVRFVCPVHMNPNVRKLVHDRLGKFANIHLIEPCGYQQFSMLLKYAYLVLTDSGGIQEEAPSFGKPVLVMRDVTERPEGVLAGTVKLVSSNKSKIVEEVTGLLLDSKRYEAMSEAHNPYGDGHASQRIADVLHAFCLQQNVPS
jgi:UDP-N-acetylglucosamine 2-epimerase (non-hydrolysing)